MPQILVTDDRLAFLVLLLRVTLRIFSQKPMDTFYLRIASLAQNFHIYENVSRSYIVDCV